MTFENTKPTARPARATAFRRPVSPPEWFYLAACRLGSAMVLQLVVEGEGSPDPEQLRAAVAAAAEACPGSRLVRRGRVWVDSGRPPLVRVAPAGSGPDAELRTGVSVFTQPLDLRGGPACEVLLLPGTAERPTTLVFRAFHGVMDGHGAQLWTAEVFRALRGEQPRPARSPLTDRRLLAEVGATGRRPALLLDQPSPLPAPAGGRPSALWRRRTVPGRHPSLTARLAQALADATGADRARIMVPVDLRRHLSTGAVATGNLSLPVFLDLRPGGSWRGAQSQMLRALAEQRELSGGFESALARLPLPVATAMLRTGQSVALRRDRHMASAIVSHLGRADLSDCSGGGFTARTVYALPVQAPLVPVSCVVVELPDRIELIVGCQGGPDLAARADELMDRLAASLAGPAPARPAGTASAVSGLPEGPVSPAAGAVPSGAREVPGAPHGHAATVVQLLREQAARTPLATALDGPEGPVSYAELDARSDAVAAELLRRGIPREAVVGLVVERSPAGVAALWGVLKAGAAYLPLDPKHPPARIGQVLGEAHAEVCLTERGLSGRVAGAAPCPVLAVEDVPDLAPGTAAPTRDPAPEQLAYVIYTSGSTGRPKGVQVEHRSLLAFVRWAAELCRVDEGTRFAFLSSYSFDMSLLPLFLPPLHGATAVLVPGEPTKPALRDLLARHRPDTFAITPSHLGLFEHYDLDLGGLRTLLLGGEQLTRAAADRARRRLGPDARIVNAYGPTEATGACLAHVLDGREAGPVVAIGHPGPSAQVELVDGDGELIGQEQVGAVGEILVSGLQLARGYLGRPDLDAERFPVGPDGVRRYRTGDLGRRLPGGAIEFVGRNDEQVKIAGHRIEPAEVHTALEDHPAVQRAAVTVRTRPGGAPALCAYVLPAPAEPVPDLPAVLRRHLVERLPAHLVPAVVLPVAGLPSMLSGKTDFAALPDPFATEDPARDLGEADLAGIDRPGTDLAGTGLAGTDRPDSDLVGRLTGLWSRMLGVDASLIDPDAEFQELGGDSMAVLEMLAAVADELLTPAQERHFTAELNDWLSELTIERVSAAIRRARRATDRDPAAGARA